MRRAVFWRFAIRSLGCIFGGDAPRHRPHSHELGQLTSSLRPHVQAALLGVAFSKIRSASPLWGINPIDPQTFYCRCPLNAKRAATLTLATYSLPVSLCSQKTLDKKQRVHWNYLCIHVV